MDTLNSYEHTYITYITCKRNFYDYSLLMLLSLVVVVVMVVLVVVVVVVVVVRAMQSHTPT
jgi:hypothetical protein